ncbi:MAG: rhomboid family intramembrane serine protease [Thermoplasmatota archaeon]
MVDFGNRVVTRGEPSVWRPKATYALLAAMVAVWIVEELLYHAYQEPLLRRLFVIGADWPVRPWTVVTSTFAHDYYAVWHILFNGLFLFFMGPNVERLLGTRLFTGLFVVAGAISGVLQVELSALSHQDSSALGASGALMALLGVLIVLAPKMKVLLWFVIPLPLWVLGVVFAFLDVLGAFDTYSTVGHYAHLSGIAIGLATGWYVKRRMSSRGLRIVSR